jgi:asparagine N-glycosylation enzyme membrane subunit Stt3
MRHLIGLVLAVLAGAALFLGGGWGVNKIATLHASGASLASTHGIIALAAAGGVGLLLGILLAVPAISPLGAGLPGLALLGWSALLVVSQGRATRLIPLPGHSFAAGFASLLTTGVLALLGAVMIVPLFVPSRWRRRYREDDDDFDGQPSEVGLMR